MRDGGSPSRGSSFLHAQVFADGQQRFDRRLLHLPVNVVTAELRVLEEMREGSHCVRPHLERLEDTTQVLEGGFGANPCEASVRSMLA